MELYILLVIYIKICAQNFRIYLSCILSIVMLSLWLLKLTQVTQVIVVLIYACKTRPLIVI